MRAAIPILRIFDTQRAAEFWIDYLGFEVMWEHRFEPDLPLYMEIRRGDSVIHFERASRRCLARCPSAD